MNPNTVYRIFVNKQPYFVMCENLLKGLIYLPDDLRVEHVVQLAQVEKSLCFFR